MVGMMSERDRWLAGHITDDEFNGRPRAEYDIADSIHRGDAFDVFDIEAGAVTIVRREDGAERFLQPEDGERLVSELDILGAVFDDNTAYVVEADRQLSEYFADEPVCGKCGLAECNGAIGGACFPPRVH